MSRVPPVAAPRNREGLLVAPADKAAACRGCGRSTAPNGGDDKDGWRRCPACGPWLAADDHGRAWGALLGDPTITEAEGRMLTHTLRQVPAYVGAGKPSDPGTRKPWQWVPKGLADGARSALRRHRDDTAVRRHPKGPCVICGQARHDGWTVRDGEPVCGACEPLLRRHGWPTRTEPVYDDVVTALALGIGEPWMGLGRDVPVRPYAVHVPGGPGGEPWAHVPAEDRRRARLMLAERHPKVAAVLTDDERAEVDTRRRAAAVAAEHARVNAAPPPPIVVPGAAS